MKSLVSASILSADVSKLAEVTEGLEKAKVDMLHFDVMDGVFVNNISFGVPILEAINRDSELFMDVHLMIINPLQYIEAFAKAGADLITFHYESESNIQQTIDKIHSLGKKAGLSIKPNTPIEEIFPFMESLDLVLVMSVEPGFGGQGFIIDSLEKVKKLREYIISKNLNTDIEIDGGINNQTGKAAFEAGANILVSGSYLYKTGNVAEAIASLKF